MIDLYIYYSAPVEHGARLLAALAAMQTRLAPLCAAAPQLKRRPHAPDGVATWMEVYPGTGPGFEAALAQALAQADLARWISGARHSEAFVDMTPCA
ncbi:MAG: DUF4936 family protein [Pseudomonadota bacterium]